MERVVGFFNEAPGVRSMTRLGFFTMVMVACAVLLFQTYTHYQKPEVPIDWFQITSFIVTAATLKLVQKGQEVKGVTDLANANSTPSQSA